MSVLSSSSADAAGVITVTSDTAGEPIYASVRSTAYGAGDEQTIADGTGAIWTSGEITSVEGVNTFQTSGVSGDQFYGVVQGAPGADYSHDFTAGDSSGLITLGGFSTNHRASGGMVMDADSMMRVLPDNAPIIPGASHVYNAIEELYWWRDDGATIARSGDDRIIAFDSTGKRVYKLAESPYSDELIEGAVYALAVDLKGAGTVTLGCGRNIGGTDTPATVTITLTGSYVRYAVLFTGLAGNQGVEASITAGTATSCTAKNAQLENISGAAIQTPSDFVTNLTARAYSKRNANTLSSNIVTSVPRTVDITGIDGVLIEPEAYDMLPTFGVIEDTKWSEPASWTAQDGDGMRGTRASSLAGENTNSYAELPKFGDNLVVMSMWAKKRGTDTSCQLTVTQAGGGPTVWGLYDFDTLSASIRSGTGTAAIINPINVNGWMRVSLTFQGGFGEPINNSAKIGSSSGYPADFYMDGVQLEQSPVASSNINPRGTGGSRAETTMTATFADIGVAPANNNLAIAITLIIGHTEGELCGLGDRTNGLYVDLDGTTLSCTKYIAGAQYIATGTVPAYAVGESVDIVAEASDSGVSCTWNATEITNANTDNFAASISAVIVGNAYNTCKTIGVSSI